MSEIAELLEKLAQQLGVTVEYLWPLLVKQTVYDWWGGFIAAFIAAVICVIVFKKLWSKVSESRHEEAAMAYGSMGILAGVFAIISSISVICHIENISCVLVPEAATIERLISAAAGG